MDCKRYKRWLGDAALEALDHSREVELRAHLAICSECSADLERERRLLAAIDRVIDEGQKAGPSPQFARACGDAWPRRPPGHGVRLPDGSR